MSLPRTPEREGTHWPGCGAQRQNALHQPPRISRPRSCLGSLHAGVCREGAPEWGGLLWALLLVLRTAWLPRCLHQRVPQVLLFCTAHTFTHSPQLSSLVTSPVPRRSPLLGLTPTPTPGLSTATTSAGRHTHLPGGRFSCKVISSYPQGCLTWTPGSSVQTGPQAAASSGARPDRVLTGLAGRGCTQH